jgi:hypothetical protein
MFFEDTDIMVFELAAGQSTNLTDDGYDGSQIAREGNQPSTMPVDVFPAWTPDSQALVFARTDAVLEDQQPTDLMQVARDGGPPEFLHAAHPAMPLSVNTPIHVLAGGTVLFAVASTDPGDDLNGVWRLDPDGEATMLMPGNRADPFPLPSIVDVGEGANGPIATGFSRSPSDILAPFGFTLDVGTGEVTPNERDPETLLQPVAVTFAPDASTTVALVLAGAAGQLVVTSPDGSASDLGEVEATSWTLERGIDWAATDTLLVPYREGGGMLLTVTRGAG